jgi:prevent-host-death family protein
LGEVDRRVGASCGSGARTGSLLSRNAYAWYDGVCTLACMEVGVRELRARLSEYLLRVGEGAEVVVTERGVAVARIVPIEGGRALDRAIAAGLVRRAPQQGRSRPRQRVASSGSVSDLVSEQRR